MTHSNASLATTPEPQTMADGSVYNDVTTVRSLTPGDIEKWKNAQLKQALSTLIKDTRSEEPLNSALLDELRSVKQAIAEVATLKQEVTRLSEKLDNAHKVIHQQQLFLESLDGRDRRHNLIATGVAEDADELGNGDIEKISNIMEAAECGEEDRSRWSMKRLGQRDDRSKRLILITVNDQNQRDSILRKAKNLKNAQQPASTVYIKKDVHPAMRKETARLRKREREEKEKVENVDVNITYDWKNRVLTRDGVIIDRFMTHFFQH